MANRSLVISLVKSAALWAVPALLICAVTLTLLYRNTIYRSFDEPLESVVTALIASVEVDGEGQLRLVREPLDPRFQRALSGRYWLIGKDAGEGSINVLMSSRSLYGETLDVPARAKFLLKEKAGEFIRTPVIGPDPDEPLRGLARQVVLPKMSEPVTIICAADRLPASRSIRQFAMIASILLAILTLGLVTAVFAQVRVGLRPLFTLRDKLADVRAGRSAQVDGVYPREIAPLAIELNSLISHNKDIIERARTHVGNLAHGLKTPIAVLQNEARVKSKMSSDIVLRQTELMSSQVGHHLRRARAAARGQSIGITTSVDEIIDGLMRTLPRIYREKKLNIVKEGEAGLVFRGAKRDLEDMIGNLMDNAAKWNKNKILVTTGISPNGSELVVLIEDDGPGLKGDDYSEALKRGARLDEATPGSGLGLSIVDDLASAYEGQIVLSKSDLGGLKATLTLPTTKAVV